MSITVLIVIAVLVFLGLLAWLWMRNREPGESDVLAPVRCGPRSSAGAVALEEREEDDDRQN